MSVLPAQQTSRSNRFDCMRENRLARPDRPWSRNAIAGLAMGHEGGKKMGGHGLMLAAPQAWATMASTAGAPARFDLFEAGLGA
jgi:hypothetical protein